MKIKNMKKKIVPALVGSAITVVAAVPVLAADSGGGGMASVESALTTSFTEVGSSMTGMIGKILPIALPVMAGIMLVVFGIKTFKKVVNKA